MLSVHARNVHVAFTDGEHKVYTCCRDEVMRPCVSERSNSWRNVRRCWSWHLYRSREPLGLDASHSASKLYWEDVSAHDRIGEFLARWELRRQQHREYREAGEEEGEEYEKGIEEYGGEQIVLHVDDPGCGSIILGWILPFMLAFYPFSLLSCFASWSLSALYHIEYPTIIAMTPKLLELKLDPARMVQLMRLEKSMRSCSILVAW